MMNNQSIRLLLVQDDIADASKFRTLLEVVNTCDYQIKVVERLSVALKHLREEKFDVIIFDISRNNNQGIDSIHHIEKVNNEVAIVVIGENTNENYALKIVKSGAQDYLVKGQGDGFLIARSIRYAIEHKREKKRLSYMAQYDLLTGLANRTLFREMLDKSIARSKRGQSPLALMFLDLDRFKMINDTLGHDIGDQLLKVVSKRLLGCVRTGDLVSRLGGDEFTVILERVSRIQDVDVIAQKIIYQMTRPMSLSGNEVAIGASIGIAVCPDHGTDAETLIKNADTAMYITKENGRNNFVYFTPDMGDEASNKLETESSLRKALERREFVLHYQPQFSLQTKEILGVEALIRWKRPESPELVQPSEFIPVAEETGMMTQIGEWVIDEACAQNKAWQESGHSPIRMAVNLSALQFSKRELVTVVQRALKNNKLAPAFFELELTEALIMEHMLVGAKTLKDFSKMGLSISIDDFGTGYTSLNVLKQLPIDTLKIDQTFMKNIASNESNAAVATAIIALGKSMNFNVIAEGIESKSQLDFLVKAGCLAGQGNVFCKPLPADEFINFFQRIQNKKLAVVR